MRSTSFAVISVSASSARFELPFAKGPFPPSRAAIRRTPGLDVVSTTSSSWSLGKNPAWQISQ